MPDPETRVSLIFGVCQQDPDRWFQFDTVYRPIILAYLLKRGLKEFEANDVVQEIFVKLLGKIHTYDRTRCRFRTWLFSVAQHTLIDFARRQAAYQKAIDGWAAQILQASVSDSARMEEEWTHIHREKILRYALKKVRARSSTKSWMCFEQRLLRNQPAADTGRALGITADAVYVNACRVLKRVRRVCEQFDEDMSHAFESDMPSR